MAVLFFDSSGLVKNYVTEAGTPWVQTLMALAADHDRYVAQITGAEMIAAARAEGLTVDDPNVHP